MDEGQRRAAVPTPSAYAAVSRAYDAVAADYARQLPDTRAEADLDLAMLDDFIACVSTAGRGPVLDAGCGAGRLTRYLADRGCSVAGMDVSPGMVTAARRAHPDLTFAVDLLIAFQAGVGTHDLAPTYRRSGHDVQLHRHLFDVGEVAAQLRTAGLHETSRLVRAARGTEEDPRAMLIARTTPDPVARSAGRG